MLRYKHEYNCRLTDDDEFSAFDSAHATPQEEMAANHFVLLHCARDYHTEDSIFDCLRGCNDLLAASEAGKTLKRPLSLSRASKITCHELQYAAMTSKQNQIQK